MNDPSTLANPDSRAPNSGKLSRFPLVLIVGIGSPHGDDQLGWLVANDLMRRSMEGCQVRIAVTPIELFNWIDQCIELHLVDACQGEGPAGTVYRLSWPCAGIQAGRWSGTHDFSLQAVLNLAEQLGQLPQRVVVWGLQPSVVLIEDRELSEFALRCVVSAADRIQAEVQAFHWTHRESVLSHVVDQ